MLLSDSNKQFMALLLKDGKKLTLSFFRMKLHFLHFFTRSFCSSSDTEELLQSSSSLNIFRDVSVL